MVRFSIPLITVAAIAGLATTAHAGLVTEPLGVVAVDYDIALDGTTLVVSATNSVALTHNDPINCIGAGTSTITCTMVGDSTVAGRSGDDTFVVAIDAASNTHTLTLDGRAGDDDFEVVEADGGELTILGGPGLGSYTIGDAASPLAVASCTALKVYGNGGGSAAGETFDVHVDTEGFIQLYGTAGDDTFDLSGTVKRTGACAAGVDARAQSGDDTFYLDIDDVRTSVTNGPGLVRFDGGDGPDYFDLQGDVRVEGGTYHLFAGLGDDDFELNGYAYTVLDATITVPGGTVTVDGAALLDGQAGADSVGGDTGPHDPISGPIDFVSW